MPQLITGASHAEAYLLKRILNRDDVIFGDHVDFQIPGTGIFKLPSPKSLSFEHEFLTWCLDHAIYRVFPLCLTEILQLFNSVSLFREYDISLIIPQELSPDNTFIENPNQQSTMAVLENGLLIAGDLPSGINTITHTSGVYTWYEISNQIKYRLLAL